MLKQRKNGSTGPPSVISNNSSSCSEMSSPKQAASPRQAEPPTTFESFWAKSRAIQEAVLTVAIANLVIAPYEGILQHENIQQVTLQNASKYSIQYVDDNDGGRDDEQLETTTKLELKELEDYMSQDRPTCKKSLIKNINEQLGQLLESQTSLEQFNQYMETVIKSYLDDISKKKKWDIVLCKMASDSQYMTSQLVRTLSQFVHFAE